MKNYIKEIRSDRGLTLEKLAEKTGTTHQQISNLEKSNRRLTWEWIQRLARALDCHPIEITEGLNTALPKNEYQKQALELMQSMSEKDQAAYISQLRTAAKKTKTPKK